MMAFACPNCDFLHASAPSRGGDEARCIRCGGALSIPDSRAFETSLATVSAAVITFWVANTEPLMRLSEFGLATSTTVAPAGAR